MLAREMGWRAAADGFDSLGNRTYHARAMGSPLTQPATPAELAVRRQVIETEEQILGFPRLAASVEAELAAIPEAAMRVKWRQFPVSIRLRFGWADSRQTLVVMAGEAGARVAAVCQRCLQPFEFDIRTDLDLLLLPPDSGLPPATGLEIWELQDVLLRPVDLVDEALVMALPMVPRHEGEQDCQPLVSETPAEHSDTVRPFADLRSQIRE